MEQPDCPVIRHVFFSVLHVKMIMPVLVRSQGSLTIPTINRVKLFKEGLLILNGERKKKDESVLPRFTENILPLAMLQSIQRCQQLTTESRMTQKVKAFISSSASSFFVAVVFNAFYRWLMFFFSLLVLPFEMIMGDVLNKLFQGTFPMVVCGLGRKNILNWLLTIC